MYKPAEMSFWQGRSDNEEESSSLRWHQVIHAWSGDRNLNQAPTLLGFACDEGVRRNNGRPGARSGPTAIRSALANLAYHGELDPFDAGDIYCDGQKMEAAQQELAINISQILQRKGQAIILGGGHEMAWGSFHGLVGALKTDSTHNSIGIINFDAHFDLRNPKPQSNSGTPFRQIAHWCETNTQPFNYLVLGINSNSNTDALFEFASSRDVIWHEDIDCQERQFDALQRSIDNFLQPLDSLYLTICMDAFPAHAAPGVSAPSALGIEPALVIKLIRFIKESCRRHKVSWRLSDIAEMNPDYDQDGHTAKLAARLITELA